MKYYTIGKVSAITRISRDRIRNYEKQGILTPHRDNDNDYRLYSEHDIAKLQTVEMYRYADFGINDITNICTDSSIPEIQHSAEQKAETIEKEIVRLKKLKQRSQRIIEKCRIVTENLNTYSVGYFDDYEIIDELNDYASFEDYEKIYINNKSEKPVVYKIQRKITYDETGILSNKMIITGKSTKKIKCLYTVVEDGERTENTLQKTFQACTAYCRENGLTPLGTVYIGMLLLMSNNNKIVSYLEIKGLIQ